MNSTTTSTAGLAFSDVLSQQRKKERLAEVKKEIALRCQVVQALGIFRDGSGITSEIRAMDEECGKQAARLHHDLSEERRLEAEEMKPCQG